MPYESAPALRPSADAVQQTLEGWKQLLQEELPPGAFTWLQETLEAKGRFPLLYTRAGRKLGFEPLGAGKGSASPLPTNPKGWPACDLGRVVLLCRESQRLSSEECGALLKTLYAKGDNRERIAVLRSLAWLRHPESGLEVAIDSCRSHVQDVFEGIACENPYPAAYFPDLHFNQMVLKAFFTEVSVARIAGLPQRQSEELKRMALAYASERTAAGRTVPADLALSMQQLPLRNES